MRVGASYTKFLAEGQTKINFKQSSSVFLYLRSDSVFRVLERLYYEKYLYVQIVRVIENILKFH